MKALVLDFDGVVSDSAREAFVVALRTRAALRGEPPPAGWEGDPEPGRFERDALYRRFLELVPLGNRAEDYGVALEALDRGISLADQSAYDAFRAARDPAELRSFHARFYAERDAWRERDPLGWRRLLAPYPELVALLRRRGREVELAIATAKDAHSVRALLRDYGIDELFPPEHVLDKETGVSKRAHLERLQRELELPFAEMTFVDDKVNHLQSVAPLGVRCALAAWGYNGPREWRLARSTGFLVCRLADAEALLFG